jgi:hypothetical protein
MKPSFLTNAPKDALFIKYSRRENGNEMEKQKKVFFEKFDILTLFEVPLHSAQRHLS